MDNLWNKSPQIWAAYGLEWRFEYNSLTANRTITASGLTLEVPVKAITKFPSPQAWLDAWAKKNKKRLPPEPEKAVNLELDLFSSTESVQVEVVHDLTSEEERDRLFLERKVERAFYEAGKALKELRDRRLYRSTHANFETYCRERFGFNRISAHNKIAAAEVLENLFTIGEQFLPTNERQVRPLTQLEPEQQREVWQQAVEAAGDKVPSGRIVKDIVQRIRERTKIPIPYRVGDVCEIIVKDNPDLRGLGGCWCIITEVREFSCLVRAWNGEYTVREENLKDLYYFPDQREAMKKLSDRLFQLQSLKEEETARVILEALGKLNRFSLNPLEEKLLEVLETYVNLE